MLTNEAPIVDLINRRFDDLNHLVRELRQEIKSEVSALDQTQRENNQRMGSLELSREKLNWTIAMISATASGLAVAVMKAIDLFLKWSS